MMKLLRVKLLRMKKLLRNDDEVIEDGEVIQDEEVLGMEFRSAKSKGRIQQ